MSIQSLSANQTAFLLSGALIATTCGSLLAVTTVVSIVATVALVVLGIAAGGAGLASISAWMKTKSTKSEEYLKNFKHDVGFCMAGMGHFASQALVLAMIQGVGLGIQNVISGKIKPMYR